MTIPEAQSTAMSSGRRRLALVLWNGAVGGAEIHSVALATHLQALGVDVTLVFLESPQSLVVRLAAHDIEYRSLGLRRGRDVLLHPREYASVVADAGPDGALLVACGFMGAALRAGGYRGSIVAVEHGDVIEAQAYSPLRKVFWRIARTAGAWSDDIEVAVSDFTLEHMRRHSHASITRRIHNGVNPDDYIPLDAAPRDDIPTCRVGFAGRLVRGKGPDYLIEAVARVQTHRALTLLIAGDGPERPRLEALVRSLGVAQIVKFIGLTHDMPAFWQTCDVAVVPSAEFIESCPLTPLEAMASARPVVATRNGGIPELIVDGETGMLIPPRNVSALADALARYADDPELRSSHGAAGRSRVVDSFDINDSAQAYLALFTALADREP
jgi:glycosyltransferase involved in cell wall biosynthesis